MPASSIATASRGGLALPSSNTPVASESRRNRLRHAIGSAVTLVLKRSAGQLAIGMAISIGQLLQSILVAGQSRDVITLLAIAGS